MEAGGVLNSSGAEHLTLRPVADIAFPAATDHKPKQGTYGGVFSVQSLDKGGLYQITTSDEAWIDVSSDAKNVMPSVAHSGSKSCPGLRKSVRFEINGPVSIQISNAASRKLDLAIAPAN